MSTIQEKENSQSKDNILAKEGTYLTFGIGKEEYGVEILKVREMIAMMNITAIPNVPDYLKGIINLRGKVIPIMDLRLKLNMKESKYTKESCIIVFDINAVLTGIIVDQIKDVVEINQNDIEPSLNFGQSDSDNCVMGIGKVHKRMQILLDIEKILNDELLIGASVS